MTTIDCIVIQISLNFVHEGPIDKSSLFQLIAGRRAGDKPSPERMMI